MPARPKPPPPRPKTTATATTTAPAANGPVAFGKPVDSPGHRIVVYGPGGIGKTTLAATAPGPVAVFDLDDSLNVLAETLDHLDVRPVQCEPTWGAMRAALAAPGWDDIKTIVIDSATRAEELATSWTLANVKHERGGMVESVEAYGYGKGYTHVYETFLTLLGDLDAHVRAQRNVILICHDCTATVPNPTGDDYVRFEPRLQAPPSGKASIRLRVREWCDHMLFLGYDIAVNKGKNERHGKAVGHGSRTIYPIELPHCMAKSRRLSTPIPAVLWDSALWDALFGQRAD